jgi:outer membrane protein, multidrug efflux system
MIRPVFGRIPVLYLSLQNFARAEPHFTAALRIVRVKENDSMRPTVKAQQIAAVVLLAAAAGCAVKTSPPVSSVVPPDGWRQAPAAGRVEVAAEAPDVSSWWTQFNDATLSSLITDALNANPDIRSARARLREARARRVLAGQNLQPSVDGSISVSASAATDKAGGSRALASAGLDATWEPDIFGSGRFGVAASQADLEATAADLHATQVSLVAELALNYVDLRTYQARLKIAHDNLDRQAETLQLTTWRAQAGLASDLDVEQSRANVEQTRSQIPGLETGEIEAKHRLAILTGRPPDALVTTLDAAGDIPTIPNRLAIGIPADTLRQRPDVRAAERRLVAESARLGQAEAARYPSIRLTGSLGAQPLTSVGVALADTFTSSVIGGLTAPLFNRGKIRQQIEIQGAVEERALIAYEQTILGALEDVENALVELANVQRRAEALAASADASRKAADLARNRYAAGLTSYQSVLDTERTVLSAEDGLKSTEAESTSAVIRLYKALGGGWTAEPAAASNPNSQRKTS